MKNHYPFSFINCFCYCLLFAFATLFSSDIQAQIIPVKMWDKTFGGAGEDQLRSVEQTSDRGYILGGISESGISGDKSQPSKGGKDYWVIKLDANSTILWEKTFGGNDDDEFTCLKQTSDGGFILGGWSFSGISGDKSQASKGHADFWVVRLDPNGNKLWDRTFGGSDGELLNSLQQTSDGGYILGGYSPSGISGDKSQICQGGFDYWIVKLDSNGNKLWDKTFGGNKGDGISSLQQTLDGGYILGGYSDSDVSGNKSQPCKGLVDYWIIKLDAIGNKQWDKTFGGNNADSPRAIQQTSDGGYIIGGMSMTGLNGDKTQNSQGGTDYWVVKLDTVGNKLWDKTFGSNTNDDLFSLQQTSDGGYILGGTSASGISGDKSQISKGSWDFWVIKLDSGGNKIWDESLGGSNIDVLRSLKQTSDGGYILGGFSNSGTSGDKTQVSQGGYDYWIVKLGGNPLGIKESKITSSISIFPNPNQGKFNLQLNNLTSPIAEITISDLLGRTILQQEFKTTNNQLSEEINLPNAKGIYLLQLKACDQITSRKIVVE